MCAQVEERDAEQSVSLWKAAREDYRGAAKSFQQQHNLSGVIFATGNAALLTAQLGDDERAFKVRTFSPTVFTHTALTFAAGTRRCSLRSSATTSARSRCSPAHLITCSTAHLLYPPAQLSQLLPGTPRF
jgi:hypothetical protein